MPALERGAGRTCCLQERTCWDGTGSDAFHLLPQTKSFSGARGTKRRSKTEKSADVKVVGKRHVMWTPFRWPVHKRHKNDSCVFFFIDSEEEGSEDGEVF